MIVSRLDAAPARQSTHFECAAACSWLTVRSAEVPALRSQVSAAFDGTLGNGVLKQADEQSLVALLALRRALDEAGLRAEDMQNWGVVASARMPGRRRVAEQLVKFRAQGAWTTSPHVIPHCSLHSMSGLLSQGLRLHGPNFGTGGMAGSETEAFWAGLTLLQGERLPGVWIVLTGWNRESLHAGDLCCQAVSLGLQSVAASPRATVRFELGPAAPAHGRLTLEALTDAVRGRLTAAWNLGGAVVSLNFANARLEAA